MNRLHLLLTLTLSLIASGAFAVEYTSKRCTNLSGLYCNGAANADCCGSTLAAATSGAGLDETGVDGSATVSLSGGTLYGCLHPSETPPTAAQLIAGASPCTSAKSISSPTAGQNDFTTSNSKRFTITTPGDTYAASYLHDDGTHRFAFQIRTTAPFTAPAGGGAGGSDLTGLVYVVDSVNGNDSNTGLSVAQAWKTLEKVNNNVTTQGADVCLMTGSVFEDEQLFPDWGGTASDLGRIGGCYANAGALYWLDEGPEAGANDNPEINGTWEAACRNATPMTCTLGTASNVPSGIYQGLVDFGAGNSHMQLTDVDIMDSAGRGVDMEAASYIVVQRVNIGYAAISNFVAEKNSRYWVFQNSTADHGANCEMQEKTGNLPSGFVVANCGASSNPACVISARNVDAYALIQGVTVTECEGEAINLYNSTGLWVDQNHVYNSRVDVYGDHTDNAIIVRNITGGAGPRGATQQSGIHLSMEAGPVGTIWQGGSQNFIGYNILSGTTYGVGFTNMSGAAATAGLKQWGLFWYNTTLSSVVDGLMILGAGASATDAQTRFVGNLVATPQGLACDARTANGDWSYNLWPTGGAGDADCVGTGDVSATLTWPHTAAQYLDVTQAQTTGDWGLTDYTPTGGGSAHLGIVTRPSVPSWLTTLADSSEWDFVRDYSGGFGVWAAGGCTGDISAAALLTDAACQTVPATSDAGAIQ